MPDSRSVVPRFAFLITIVLMCVPAFAQKAPLCPIDLNGRVAEVFYEGSAIFWQPLVEHDRLRLTVSTPCGTIVKGFRRGETPSFALEEVAGEVDGQYSWELRVDPAVDPRVRKALDTARQRGSMSVPLELQGRGLLPKGPLVDSASFSVANGQIVDPSSGREETAAASAIAAASSADASPGAGTFPFTLASDGLRSATAEVVLTNADGVIRNSLCVGFDCPNNPAFSDTTILLVENNTRIKFDDTSVLAGFPNRDWELQANSGSNGGGSFFAVNDCGTGSGGGCADDPILILEANAPANSIRVDDGGRVGFGTATPSVELHVVDGDTPTLRLQQDGSSGFEPQTWDVAGNETNFFVRDATNGSTLPFRIRPGAPTSSILVDVDGDVGMGTSSPAVALHVRRTTGSARLRVEDTTGDAILNALELLNAGEVRVAMEDTSAANRRWEFRTTGPNFQFTRSTAPAADLLIDTAGNLTVRGNLVTGGGGACDPGPCDGIFAPEYEVETIEEHAAYMWANRHLWGVGPTPEGAPIDLTKKTTGILHELEKAHIYIEQLHREKREIAERQAVLEQQLARLEAAFASLRGGSE